MQKEISHMRDYIEIQRIRFQNRVTVESDEMPEDCKDKLVPRLILQPVVENAFCYGLKDKVGAGRIWIRLRRAGSYFSVFIEDNGDSLCEENLEEIRALLRSSETEYAGSSSALVNIHRRIRIKFGPGSGLLASRSKMGGLCVEIRIKWDGERGGTGCV